MEVVALTPLPTAALLWATEKRGWSLTVVCKATFDLGPGLLHLASDQLPIHRADQHYDGDPKSSVYAPSDLAPFKPRTDVLVLGHAHARSGIPTTALVAKLKLGSIEKALRFHGRRVRGADGTITAGELSSIPLRYEQSAGGPGKPNPVGMASDGAADESGAIVLPGIELASKPYEGPIGFGPLSARWPTRSSKLGRHEESWSHDAWYEGSLPRELDLSYFNVAPEDQQLDLLAGDETIELVHLHPRHAKLRARLPRLSPAAYVERDGWDPELVNLRCDTVWIDTDLELVTLTWRGQLRLDDPAVPARALVVVGRGSRTLAWEQVRALSARHGVVPWNERPPESLESARGEKERGRELEVHVPATVRATPADAAEFLAADDVLSLAPGDDDEPPPASTVNWQTLRPVIKVIWYDEERLADIGRQSWARSGGEAPGAGDAAKARWLHGLLSTAPQASAAAIETSVADAAEQPGGFEAPLVASAGTLKLSFDDVAVLRAMVTVAVPFAAGDDKLRAFVRDARALIELPWLERSGPAAEELAARIRDAFARAPQPMPPGWLDAQTGRIVVEERRYLMRALWGRRWIRGSFTPEDERVAIVAYLPAELADRLPMGQQMSVRVIAEVDLREDHYESHPLALRIVALGRVEKQLFKH